MLGFFIIGTILYLILPPKFKRGLYLFKKIYVDLKKLRFLKLEPQIKISSAKYFTKKQ